MEKEKYIGVKALGLFVVFFMLVFINPVAGGIGDMFEDFFSGTTGKVITTSLLVGGSFVLNDKITDFLAGDNPVASKAGTFSSSIGTLGALVGSFWGPGVGAISGAVSAVVGGITGLIVSAANSNITTLNRNIVAKVKALDLNSAEIRDAKYKLSGDSTNSSKFDLNYKLNDNDWDVYQRKSGTNTYAYYPIKIITKSDEVNKIESAVLYLETDVLKSLYGTTSKMNTDVNGSKASVIGAIDAINLEKDGKIVEKEIGWCKIDKEGELAKKDQEVYKENIETPAENERTTGRDTFMLLFRMMQDSNQYQDVISYSCFGPNNRLGITGTNNKPRVNYNWKYDAVNCKDNFCDATQLTELLFRDKLTKLDINLDNGLKITSTSELDLKYNSKDYNLLHFKANLMKDGYTIDFMNDFKEYVSTGFLSNVKHKKEIVALISSGKLEFLPMAYKSIQAEGYQLPYAGEYNVDIVIDFNEPVDDISIFTYNYGKSFVNSKISKIKVYLEPVTHETNPLYYMPMDATVGVVNGVIDRVGYGIDFSVDENPDNVKFSSTAEDYWLEPSLRSSSTPIVHLELDSTQDFQTMNTVENGYLLKITPKSGINTATYNVTRYLSKPFVFDLSIKKENDGDAYAFYQTVVDNQTVTAGSSLIYWTFRSSNDEGKTFDGSRYTSNVYVRDTLGTNAKVAPVSQLQGITYGLEWDEQVLQRTVTDVNYRGIFYAPNESTNVLPEIKVASDSATINSTSKDKVYDSLEDIINGMDTNDVCMTYEGAGLSFWWNPEKLLNLE